MLPLSTVKILLPTTSNVSSTVTYRRLGLRLCQCHPSECCLRGLCIRGADRFSCHTTCGCCGKRRGPCRWSDLDASSSPRCPAGSRCPAQTASSYKRTIKIINHPTLSSNQRATHTHTRGNQPIRTQATKYDNHNTI